MPIIDQTLEENLIGPDGKALPPAVYPPVGTIFKLTPNATLIDLKKIKEKQDFNKPIRIEEVTVMIDEKDTVKVIDYGPKSGLKSYSAIPQLRIEGSPKQTSWTECQEVGRSAAVHDNINYGTDSILKDFEVSPLGMVMEQMRLLRIDCNVAITDALKGKAVYAHRAVLVSRSPYFYRLLYLKRKKHKCLHEFCKFVLPIQVDSDVIEAVVTFMYTGILKTLLGKKIAQVRELLMLLEMKDTLELYNREVAMAESEERIGKKLPKEELMETGDDLGVSVMVMPYEEDERDGGTTPVIEVNEERPEAEKKKKRKIILESECGDDYRGRLKVSVQKIVDNALIPILNKIEELFGPAASTLQTARTSQHILTFWNADILLTKLFDQNDLTTFFSDVLKDVLGKNEAQIKAHTSHESGSGAFAVETFYTNTGKPVIDEAYTKPYIRTAVEQTVDQPIQTLMVGDTQIIDYSHLSPKHISKYVHMIAMYRFSILMKRKNAGRVDGSENSKLSPLIPNFFEGDVLQDNSGGASHDMEALFKRIPQEEQPSSLVPVAQTCFQQLNVDLKRRVVADLELYVNPSFHEELIMHIIVDTMNDKNILPMTMGIFLAKGCNFCRKKECKAEDLSIPVSPDNPVCPDRQCIKRNLQCDICNKQMSTSKSLARHRYSVHDIETGDTTGLFICSHCGETFSKKWKLNIHERDHEDRKMELICRYCKKKIRGTIALKKHIAMVHEAKPQFSCDTCSKVFKRRETLWVHRRIHTGEKPFRCYHCDYASETKGNLKAHIARKHKLQFVQFCPQDARPHIIPVVQTQPHPVLPEDDVDPQSIAEDQVMPDTYVAHSLSDGSYFITETTPNSIVH